jgi:hypothetical protein
MRVSAMRAGKSLSVSSADIRRLKALVHDRNAPQKHAWRAEIVLLTAEGVGTNEIMRKRCGASTVVFLARVTRSCDGSGLRGLAD